MPKIIDLNTQLKNFTDSCFTGEEAKTILRMYNSCVEQTKKFVQNARFSDVLIGLSGGIDSSLVAKIAVDAFGKEHVHGMFLPGPYTSEESIKDAKLLADNLDIDTSTVFINSSYDLICELVNNSALMDEKEISDLTSQNIQSRLRMLILMAASNEKNWLLLNTANKSEVYTGYSTLYGDMAGGFAPIGDVYKCDVYKMAVAKNLQEHRLFENDIDIIPQNIITKAPSAELTENQTDENSLGIDYASLDAILHEHIDNNKNAQEIVFLGYAESDVQTVLTKVKKSEYKRRYEPPCAKLI